LGVVEFRMEADEFQNLVEEFDAVGDGGGVEAFWI
jgi:hypothetical protein